ncbi:hypothetical protein P59_241 [Bacillus phage P59]|nr:hypothetical protein P59_012 [Bacillus phage P59]QIW88838.1 hypothetical protein P59_241 [Bacillus phage P59]
MSVSVQHVVNYLLNNMEETKQAVQELNSWDGSFDHLEFHHNDEDFFNTFFDGNPAEAVRAAHFGEYNYGDDYVRFNGYGNLESFNDYQLEQDLKDELEEIAEAIIEKQAHLSLDPELESILDEEEEDEDEE